MPPPTPTTPTYEDAYILMHPLRRRIIEILLKKGESYTAGLARALDMKGKERLIGFHLTVLAKNGFVEGEFKLANPVNPTPKAVKYYHLTDKTISTLKKIPEELSR